MSAIFIGLGGNGENQSLDLGRANRHGLIAGATGTGKTVTLQGLAESFSARGVPVFLADVKGDLSGIAMPSSPTFKHADKLESRARELGINLLYAGHYATETFGVKRLAAELAQRFELDWEFVDHPTGL